MRIFRNIPDAGFQEGDFGPAALTIGNFDGVHAGHRALLRTVTEAAKQQNLRPAALTFDPHPACIVAPDRAPRLLTSVDERCVLMGELGIENILVLPFTPDLARLTPEEFVAQVLKALGARVVAVGKNFRFGHQHAGDADLLSSLGERYGYSTLALDPVKWRGITVSSSEVRRRIEAGEVALAARLLQRPHALSGKVVSGHGVGSKQTVPTLNLETGAQVLPGDAVYVTRTLDRDTGRQWNSITNIGYRPTFNGARRTIETFLLDPLTGATPQNIRVDFLRRVRGEKRFDNPEALKRQILRDVARAQSFFRRLARWVPRALA